MGTQLPVNQLFGGAAAAAARGGSSGGLGVGLGQAGGEGKNYPLAQSGRKLLEVKNKMPAPVQITAEQLLREAVDRQLEDAAQARPQQRIVDEEELQQYRVRKRKEFEDSLRRQRHHLGTWIKYAQWEAGQREFRRARSVFERALQVDYQNISVWLQYIEMEMQNKFISSCRNLFDRVCQLLPRQEQFWFKYAHMEELLGNYAGARNVYERWMEWNPSDKGWMLYIHFEERCHELQRARLVFENYLSNRPSQEAFLRFCKFEERHKNISRARAGFEKAIELLPDDMLNEDFYIKFASFEERQHETERAKMIYQQALERLPKGETDSLYEKFVSFQKQYGDRAGIEDTVLSKRAFVYEEELHASPLNYDCWIDYIRLEESRGDIEKIRNLYERALANVPPILEKRCWTRYVYMWICYALFEELQAEDVERCREVYKKMIEIIPHKKFSFSKVWSLYASFEVRQLNLEGARRIFGRAIAECGKEKIFVAYSQLELRLGNVERCRIIYAKFIEKHPFNPRAWIAMVDLELLAEEVARARALCELAINVEQMEMPELIWKTYIDMEVALQALERARELYERLLEKTQHVKVFISYADFEWKITEQKTRARKVRLCSKHLSIADAKCSSFSSPRTCKKAKKRQKTEAEGEKHEAGEAKEGQKEKQPQRGKGREKEEQEAEKEEKEEEGQEEEGQEEEEGEVASCLVCGNVVMFPVLLKKKKKKKY